MYGINRGRWEGSMLPLQTVNVGTADKCICLNTVLLGIQLYQSADFWPTCV